MEPVDEANPVVLVAEVAASSVVERVVEEGVVANPVDLVMVEDVDSLVAGVEPRVLLRPRVACERER